MLAVSLIFNTFIFYVISNCSYWACRRHDPNCPDKPLYRQLLYPLALGIVFTLIVDAFKGIIYLQLLVFIIIALILYWVFNIPRK